MGVIGSKPAHLDLDPLGPAYSEQVSKTILPWFLA